MTDAGEKPSLVNRDVHATELTASESRALARSRKLAFVTLATCSVLAVFGAIYCWYLWGLTVEACYTKYLVSREEKEKASQEEEASEEKASVDPELADREQKGPMTVQEKMISLDISSFSALIMALLFTRLAYSGVRNTLHRFRRDGPGYFGRAYDLVLFSNGFETLCVRFGLLGTLLSFLLAAVAQLETPPPSGDTADAGEVLVSRSPQRIETGEPAAAALQTGDLSEDIFLLLCASLVSTFVGTGVAYTITPSLNWLNERAVGLHQLGRTDPHAAAESFFRQIDRTSQRLAEFDATTAKLSAAGQHVAGFEANIGAAAKRLGELVAGLERAVRSFEVSHQTSRQLAKKLDQLEAMSDRVSELLNRLPERLNDPLKNMSLTAGKFREAALSGEAAFRELKDMAGSAKDSLHETRDRTSATWQALQEVQESLKGLASYEATQTGEVTKLVCAFDRISDSLTGLVREVQSVGIQLCRSPMADHEVARTVAAKCGPSPALPSRAEPGPGYAGSPSTHAPPGGDRNESRSWWRRLFG